MSLRTEVDGAAALLGAAGIDTRLDMDLDLALLPPPVEEVLAWTVREGVTNVLRHSQARRCSITAGSRDGHLWLEMLNDGAPRPADGESGSGLVGLTERAKALSGSLSSDHTPDGRFQLLVQIPEEAA